MLDLENTHEQNVRERIERDGVAAEMLRQMYVDRLKSHNEGFYEHGSTVDIIGICQAFDLLKQEGCEAGDVHRALLVEAILALFDRPHSLFRRTLT